MIIYKTTNKINNKYYIGKDINNNPEYLGSGLLLKKAIAKYGKEHFKKEIIDVSLTLEELNEKEIYWIDKLSATTIGYNIALGGSGGDTYTNNPNIELIIEKFKGNKNHFFNKKHTKEAKEKISKSKIGRPAWNSGKTNVYSNSTKEKMSKARDDFKKENHPRYKVILEQELFDYLKKHTQKETAEYFKVSISCIQSKIKLYNNKNEGPAKSGL